MDGWIDGWMDGWVDGWVDGWMGGWLDGRAGLRIAYSNQIYDLLEQAIK